MKKLFCFLAIFAICLPLNSALLAQESPVQKLIAQVLDLKAQLETTEDQVEEQLQKKSTDPSALESEHQSEERLSALLDQLKKVTKELENNVKSLKEDELQTLLTDLQQRKQELDRINTLTKREYNFYKESFKKYPEREAVLWKDAIIAESNAVTIHSIMLTVQYTLNVIKKQNQLPTFAEYLNKTNETGVKNGKIIGESILDTIFSTAYATKFDTTVKSLCSEKGTQCGLNPLKALPHKIRAQGVLKNFIAAGKYILPEMSDPAWPTERTLRIFCETYRILYMDLLNQKKEGLLDREIIKQ